MNRTRLGCRIGSRRAARDRRQARSDTWVARRCSSFFFKDDHSPVYDYGRFDVESPANLPPQHLSLHRAERSRSVHGQPRLRRSVDLNPQAQHHADGDPGPGACTTIASCCGRPSIWPSASSQSHADRPDQIDDSLSALPGPAADRARIASTGRPMRAVSALASACRVIFNSQRICVYRLSRSTQGPSISMRDRAIHEHADCPLLHFRRAAARVEVASPILRQPPRFSVESGRRAGRHRPGMPAGRRAVAGRTGGGSGKPTSTAACIIGPRPSASCSCSCRAPPASATRSTTSPS